MTVSEELIAALSGLLGAIQNNPKTDATDYIFIESLVLLKNKADDKTLMSQRNKVHKEKFTIAPDCAVCTHPCGNTSDLNFAEFLKEPEEIRKLKLKLLEKAEKMAVELEPSVKAGNCSEEKLTECMRCVAAMNWNETEETLKSFL